MQRKSDRLLIAIPISGAMQTSIQVQTQVQIQIHGFKHQRQFSKRKRRIAAENSTKVLEGELTADFDHKAFEKFGNRQALTAGLL